MVNGIEHFAICSRDTKRLNDWYCELFGFEQVYDNGNGTYFIKDQNGCMIELISTESNDVSACNDTPGLRHIAIGVSDFEGMTAKIMAKNVEIINEPKTSDKGISTFFFRDPDGNIVHIINRKNPL